MLPQLGPTNSGNELRLQDTSIDHGSLLGDSDVPLTDYREKFYYVATSSCGADHHAYKCVPLDSKVIEGLLRPSIGSNRLVFISTGKLDQAWQFSELRWPGEKQPVNVKKRGPLHRFSFFLGGGGEGCFVTQTTGFIDYHIFGQPTGRNHGNQQQLWTFKASL